MLHLDFDALTTLRRQHPAWRLLAATNAPLVISVLYHRFVLPNVRTLSRDDLIARVDDDLFALRERLGEEAFRGDAAHYLDAWASDDTAWLRKYYPPGSDEPHYDITPATEKAIEWLAQLQERHFVGTESRLLTVFELLRQMTQGTELNPEARLMELERRKAEIEAQIQRVRNGQLMMLEPTQVKDRFLQMAATARGLLSDFRDVEQHFRELDRTVRERIATWDDSRGALLDEIFDARDAIERSDQGKSFRAFWDFLMSTERQEELSSLLRTVMSLEAVQSLTPPPDPRLSRIHYDWLEAGEVAQRTVARLSQQLRRYLDDQAWRENRRIMQLIRSVEHHALSMRRDFPDGPEMDMDDQRPLIELPTERPLWNPAFQAAISGDDVLAGDEDVDATALFEQVYVDRRRLAANIRKLLQRREQASLAEIVGENPLEQGLAELVAYLSLAADNRQAIIHDLLTETILWTDDVGRARQGTIPVVLFGRDDTSPTRP